MSRVLFIRHAETDMAGRFCGHSDPELNAEGRAQVAELSRVLSTEAIDRVYTSDLRRAQSTARAVAAMRDIPLEIRPALREIDFGRWEGLRWKEIEQMDPVYAQEWIAGYPHMAAPSGESIQAFEARVLKEVDDLVANASGPIAVVTHGGVLRVVLRHLFGRSDTEAWEQTIPNCCVMRYEEKTK